MGTIHPSPSLLPPPLLETCLCWTCAYRWGKLRPKLIERLYLGWRVGAQNTIANSLPLGSLWPEDGQPKGEADLAHPGWGHFSFGHLLGSSLISPSVFVSHLGGGLESHLRGRAGVSARGWGSLGARHALKSAYLYFPSAAAPEVRKWQRVRPIPFCLCLPSPCPSAISSGGELKEHFRDQEEGEKSLV